MNMDQLVLEGRDRVIAELESEFPVLNICDVCDWLNGTLGIDMMTMDWTEESKHILKFCENFQLYLYEVPAEDFSKFMAIEQAQVLGYKGVVLSSLS